MRRLSIAALVITAMLAGVANAAPPAPQSQSGKAQVTSCQHAKPGTRLWNQCHPKKTVKQPKASKKAAPATKAPKKELPPVKG